ncbi:MAG: HEAT repeat domain-containing protein [Planctomycetota bacterium]|nr:HEAT repeat domain-containing protein [Planctomycetota bacterium]
MIVRHQPLKLLTDTQVQQFLVNGFLVLNDELPQSFHDTLRRQCAAVAERRGGNPGNNILPHVPALQAVFESPAIKGALTSILGPRFCMHPHRHMHENRNSAGGGWHKDSYWGYKRQMRHHRPWWVMIMYYPQDTTTEMGPTGVIPGSASHQTRDGDEGALGVTGKAGTFFMIEYDIWHRATPNTSGLERYMLKFEFIRLEAPHQAAWNDAGSAWDPASEPAVPAAHRGMWRQQLNWLRGHGAPHRGPKLEPALALDEALKLLVSENPKDRARAADELEHHGAEAASAVPVLAKALNDSYEPAALNAAYALAAIGEPAVAAVGQVFLNAEPPARLNATYALAAMGREAVPALLEALRHADASVRTHAAFALGEIPGTGGDVREALERATRDEEAAVRQHAVEALSMKGAASKASVPALLERLADPEDEVRFNAVLALARLGSSAAEAVEALAGCLLDPNRYVRGYAVEALHQIGTPDALSVLIPYLKTARWCETTHTSSPFYP